ncbi:MAG: substrate-binding domain-containing protein [Pirellulaceae bacterium]
MKSVALLIETSNAYARALLDGILRYTRANLPWSLYVPEQERGALPPSWIANWQGDGIIARIESEAIANKLSSLSIPIVDVSAARHAPSTPYVETNDEKIAELAVRHFVERGFETFAYCGDPGFAWSTMRRDQFAKRVGELGGTLHELQSTSRLSSDYSWNAERSRLAEWLQELPKPIAVFACYDIKAQQVLQVCREVNIAVPESVAVLGVDNDRLLCELCTPPLSSIIPDAVQTGYQAAALLDRMMSGDHVPPEGHLIDPLGVETRQSTDVLAIEDAEVAVALQFIRENHWRGIDVSDVLKVSMLSRRVLDKRFRVSIGRTPHQEIMRLRLERVKRMLMETDLPLAEIAERCGFENSEYMPVVFRREIGQTPSSYRRSMRTP